MERLVLLAVLLTYSEALNCGIHFNRNDGLTMTINKCVNSNKTLEDLWDMSPMSAESDSSSSEEVAPVDGKMMQNFRTKRTIVPEEPKTGTEESTTTEEGSHSGSVTEDCVIQCIFEELKMTDNTGYPAHEKIIDGLTKNVTERALHDFLQDTTDECFQLMDGEPTMDPCSYSVKLVMCLADKGKSNCSDWPVGDLPFRQ